MVSRRPFPLLLARPLLPADGCALRADGAAPHWLGTWLSARQRCEEKNLPPAPGFADATLRQIVHVSLGGVQLRIHFPNAFGDAPSTIAAAPIAQSLGAGAIRPECDRAAVPAGFAVEHRQGRLLTVTSS